MSGYLNDYSMSVNAYNAYQENKKPLSKWNKTEILDLIYDNKKELYESAKKVNVKTLKSYFLAYSEWHHTGSYYNTTDFYEFDFEKLEDTTIEKVIELQNIKEEKSIPEEKKARCKYLEWSGTRQHPKATEHESVGIIKGNWFYLDNGKKKKVSANGFKILEYI